MAEATRSGGCRRRVRTTRTLRGRLPRARSTSPAPSRFGPTFPPLPVPRRQPRRQPRPAESAAVHSARCAQHAISVLAVQHVYCVLCARLLRANFGVLRSSHSAQHAQHAISTVRNTHSAQRTPASFARAGPALRARRRRRRARSTRKGTRAQGAPTRIASTARRPGGRRRWTLSSPSTMPNSSVPTAAVTVQAGCRKRRLGFRVTEPLWVTVQAISTRP